MMGQALAPEPCNYTYPFCREPTRECVRQFLQFSQVLTRWGESGVYGFLPQMDNAAVAELLLNSIATEARPQYSSRQLLGLFPVLVHFIPGIPQSWSWTLISQYVAKCPRKNFEHPVQWSIWPPLKCSNPNVVSLDPVSFDQQQCVCTDCSRGENRGELVRER
ncbi:hypothetical protein BJ742DRAFT_841818 [Cladochytrium replicatum]|nr:hypothetical protein BJ742DRAFT_841818 [Cladochytrium replicatum]